MDADYTQILHQGRNSSVSSSTLSGVEIANAEVPDLYNTERSPRTHSTDSGYYSGVENTAVSNKNLATERRYSMEEAEDFLASITDIDPPIARTDSPVDTTNEAVGDHDNTERDAHGEEMQARESEIWEGAFGSSTPNKRERSRSSSAQSVSQSDQKHRRLSAARITKRVCLVQDLEWKAVETDMCVFAVYSGLDHTGVIAYELELCDEVAQAANNWGHKADYFDLDDRSLRILMSCFRKDSIQLDWSSEIDTSDENKLTTLAKRIGTIPHSENAWTSLPPTCIILGSKSWSMYDLSQHMGSIEISADLQPGKNNLQIAHLGDASNYLFILHTEQPSPFEKMAANLGYLRTQRKKAIREFLTFHSSSV